VAVITKINASQDYNPSRATVGRGCNAPQSVAPPTAHDADGEVAAIDAVLDTRFDAGGTTTWERPAQ
jgi:hypothetical protein